MLDLRLADIESAARIVYEVMPPTPQFAWPLLSRRTGASVVVKHENHTPVGAFKIRGGLVYLDWLRSAHPEVRGIVTATRGNHGQSIALAAQRHGLAVTIVVPIGNSTEKNAAMRALGATVVESGGDFQESVEVADRLARDNGWHRVPSFHSQLVRGVATYALEFLRAFPALDTIYVPIGQGSGICGMIAARDALGFQTKVVGVVSAGAPAYALSLAAGRPVSHAVTTRIADGMACRTPVPDALEIIARGAERIVTVTDAEVEGAMRIYFSDTHNAAEGAGAAALAALIQEADTMRGRGVGLVLSGGNVDSSMYSEVIASTP